MQRFLDTKYSRKQLITAGIIASVGALTLAFGKRHFNGGVCHIRKDLTGKVVLITGANTGIGKETARELAKMGATLILACRDPKRTLPVVEKLKAETGNQSIEFIKLDLADLASIREFAEEFKAKYLKIDILINNAGIMALPKRTLTKDGFEAQFGTNHLGHFYLTNLLLDVIKASAPSRIINVSSLSQEKGKINWDDLMFANNYSPINAYRQSKLANVMFSRELQRRLDLEKADVKVVSLHPGLVRTELNRHMYDKPLVVVLSAVLAPVFYFFSKSAHQGAQTTLYCALEDQKVLQGGGYYSDCKIKAVNPLALDDEALVRLWNVSENLIGEKIGI